MVEKRSFKNKLTALIIFSGGMFFQAVTFAGLMGLLGFFNGIYLISAHFVGAVLIATAFFKLSDKNRTLFFYLSLMLSVIFPLLGGLSVAVICLYRIVVGVNSLSEDELDISLDEESIMVSDENTDVDADRFIRQKLDVESFSDILRSDNFNLKRSVIEILARKDDKDSIKLLKSALKDPDPEIRFHASTGLCKVGESFQKRILALQEEFKLDTGSFETNLLLAKEYFSFCRSRLVDSGTQKFYLDKGLESINRALKIKPDNVDALLVLGKIKIETQEYQDALKQLDKAYSLDEDNWNVLIWRCEANFYLGRFDQIKKDCRAVSNLKPVWDSVGKVTNYWMKDAS